MGGDFGLDICNVLGDLAFAIHRVFAMQNYRRDCCNFVFFPHETQNSHVFHFHFVIAGRVLRSGAAKIGTKEDGFCPLRCDGDGGGASSKI